MATRVNSDYISVNAAKAWLGITDASDDARLAGVVTAASRAVDSICLRPSAPGVRGGFWHIAACTAFYSPEPGYPALIGDWATITSVAVSDDGGGTWTTLTAGTGYQAEPLNAALASEPAQWIRRLTTSWPTNYAYPGQPSLRIVGNLGWSTVPEDVVEATKLLASRWYKRKDAPLGVTTGDFGAMFVRRQDPDVVNILSRLIWSGAGVG